VPRRPRIRGAVGIDRLARPHEGAGLDPELLQHLTDLAGRRRIVEVASDDELDAGALEERERLS
jgi:hypothetical protein